MALYVARLIILKLCMLCRRAKSICCFSFAPACARGGAAPSLELVGAGVWLIASRAMLDVTIPVPSTQAAAIVSFFSQPGPCEAGFSYLG